MADNDSGGGPRRGKAFRERISRPGGVRGPNRLPDRAKRGTMKFWPEYEESQVDHKQVGR